MKRIFIAIKVIPGENLTRMHSAFRSQLAGERITWVDPSNIHITLAFLGDTPEEKLNEISEVLKDQCSNTGSFAFEIAGAGVFRNLKDPRVIWAGIRSPEKLVDLGNKIQSALRNKGFSLDDKPFRPHITLGRIKHLNDLSKIENLINSYKDYQIQELLVKEVILYESILRQTGPEYRALKHFLLDAVIPNPGLPG